MNVAWICVIRLSVRRLNLVEVLYAVAVCYEISKQLNNHVRK